MPSAIAAMRPKEKATARTFSRAKRSIVSSHWSATLFRSLDQMTVRAGPAGCQAEYFVRGMEPIAVRSISARARGCCTARLLFDNQLGDRDECLQRIAADACGWRTRCKLAA